MKLFVAVLLLALTGKSAAWTFSEGRHPKSQEPIRDYVLYLANTTGAATTTRYSAPALWDRRTTCFGGCPSTYVG